MTNDWRRGSKALEKCALAFLAPNSIAGSWRSRALLGDRRACNAEYWRYRAAGFCVISALSRLCLRDVGKNLGYRNLWERRVICSRRRALWCPSSMLDGYLRLSRRQRRMGIFLCTASPHSIETCARYESSLAVDIARQIGFDTRFGKDATPGERSSNPEIAMPMLATVIASTTAKPA